MGWFRKPVGAKASRGFESPPLRHFIAATQRSRRARGDGHMNDTAPSVVAAIVGVSLFAAMIARAVRSGRWPRLPEPDPATVRTARDHAAYIGANVLALLCGAAAGALLWALPPEQAPQALFRISEYDHAGRA